MEAWDAKRICSLLDAIIKNLPLGATLIHQVGIKELFVSRYLNTAPETSPNGCLLYTSPSPRDQRGSRMPSSA